MHRNTRSFLLLLGMLSWASPGRAADDAALRSLIDKAIQAHGGEAHLAKFQAYTTKLKGTVQIGDASVPITGELIAQGADQLRIDVALEVGGQPLRIVQVVNRDRGWVKFNDVVVELAADKLADAKEEAYADWLASLRPLTDKSLMLSAFGETTVENRPAVGVTISSKGHRAVNLFFDKETSRLVKMENQVRDEETGQLVTEETVLGAYKEIEGTQQAMKLTIRRDGKLHAEVEAIELKPESKLDDSRFAAP